MEMENLAADGVHLLRKWRDRERLCRYFANALWCARGEYGSIVRQSHRVRSARGTICSTNNIYATIANAALL